MLFPTIEFAIFFSVVFPTAWALKGHRAARKTFLVAASYFFYAFWDWRFTLLLLQCSLVNFLFGLWIHRSSNTQKRRLMFVAVSLNLSTLGFFKYYGFFVSQFNSAMLSLGVGRELPLIEIVLPVGISFFTFQGISYVIDVYRKDLEASRNPIDVLLYISFFPQLVAGPIVRASRFFGQLQAPLDTHNIPGAYAFKLIVLGLFKKMIIANYLATLLVDEVFEDPTLFNAVDVLFAVYGYAVQIYCDFSAYSDIAIGVAALLGYRFAPNFNSPYRATSLQNFWRRWHISLSTWLRDYLYIALGGSRGGRLRTYRNLLITMLLGGLWHGAAWNFIIWGALHGGVLAVERWCMERFGHAHRATRFKQLFQILFVFHFVCFTWVFFRATDLNLSFEMLNALTATDLPTRQITPFTIMLIGIGLAGQFIPQRWDRRFEDVLAWLPAPAQGFILGLVFVILGGLSPDGVAPFIYFQF